MTNRVKVGIVGAGGISYTYLKNLTETFHITEVVGIADIIEERSRRRAEQFHIRQMTVEEIMNCLLYTSWYRFTIITMYFNAGLIPWYITMRNLHLTNNFLAYILDVYKRQAQERIGSLADAQPLALCQLIKLQCGFKIRGHHLLGKYMLP